MLNLISNYEKCIMIVRSPEELYDRDRCPSSESTPHGDERQTPLVKSALDKIDVKIPQR